MFRTQKTARKDPSEVGWESRWGQAQDLFVGLGRVLCEVSVGMSMSDRFPPNAQGEKA